MISEVVETDDRDDLVQAVRQIISSEVDRPRLVTASELFPSIDRKWWSTIGNLGWPGVEIADSDGGSGGSFRDLAVIMEEMGRRPLASPLFATSILASGALMAAGPSVGRDRILPGLAAGTTTGTAVLSWNSNPVQPVRIVDGPGGPRLVGVAEHVPDGHQAEVVVVVASREDGTSRAVAVTRDQLAASAVTTEDLMDPTRPLATIAFNDVPIDADSWLTSGSADRLDRLLLRRAAVALVLDSLGGCADVLDFTVRYVASREQFGRPVGSFQAVKHHCANMFVLLAMTRIACDLAVRDLTGPVEEETDWVAVAKAYSGDAYVELTRLATQCTGGIGFTWEYGLHLYLKRALTNANLYGGPSAHRAAIADRLILEHAAGGE